MGLLTGGGSVNTSGGLLGLVGISGPKKVAAPSFIQNDFAGGLEIVEIVNGQERYEDAIVLVGAFMPHVPFEYGGTQQIVKDYYPGSSEPAIQVLGPRETETTIKGCLKTKKFKSADLREAAIEYQELIDAMRIRGNLVKITLGGWRRYGFIEETKFSLKKLTEIDYEIKLLIVGFNPPKNAMFTDLDNDPIAPNKNLTALALDALENQSQIPSSMPKSLIDDLNGIISGVAEVVSKVTGFVDSIVDDVEQVQKTANRAIGMIRYARSYIAKTSRNLSLIWLNLKNTPAIFGQEAKQTADLVKNLNFVSRVRSSNYSLADQLAALQARFAAIAKTVPMYRHRIVDGETLQKISMRYYNTADHWNEIYKHNKLTSTKLSAGAVLEIPRI